MDGTKRNSGSGCIKAIGVGCMVIVAMALVGITLIWAKWDDIKDSDWFRSVSEAAAAAQSEMGYMLDLRTSLLQVFPAENINVQAQQHRSTAGSAKTLNVSFINPEFSLPEAMGEKEGKAREIAQFIAKQYPNIERYDFVKVSFASQKGSVIALNFTSNHPFPTAELVEKTTEEP